MKRFSTVFTVLAALALAAGEWVAETPEPGVTVLRNEEGRFKYDGKSMFSMCGSGMRIKKSFDLSKLPAGVLEKATGASLRVFCNVTDYNWGKIKVKALDESVAFKINGRQIVCKTSDPRFSKKRDVKAGQRYRFTDIDFPVQWIKNGKMEVVIHKLSGGGANDYYYQGVDMGSDTTASQVSLNGGASFTAEGGCIKGGKGEAIVRLVLRTEGEMISGNPGSDISTDRDITKFRPLFLPKGAKIGKEVIVLPGTAGNQLALPGSGDFIYTGYGMTLSGIFKFAREKGDDSLFFKHHSFYLIRKGGKFVLGIWGADRKWKETELKCEMPEAGKFFHFAAVFKPEGRDCTLQLYLDGMLVESRKLGNVTIPANANGVVVGSGPAGCDFKGEVSEVSCFQRVLGDEDIAGIVENAVTMLKR